jgi:hypothetical protein
MWWTHPQLPKGCCELSTDWFSPNQEDFSTTMANHYRGNEVKVFFNPR